MDVLVLLLLSSAYSSMLRALRQFSASGSGGRAVRYVVSTGPEVERLLFYVPRSGFSNQASQLRNAAVAASLLNRILVVSTVLDRHAVILRSFPKFRVADTAALRAAIWNQDMQLLREGETGLLREE